MICNKCGEDKPEDQYNKSNSGSGGLRKICKACVKLYRPPRGPRAQKLRIVAFQRVDSFRVLWTPDMLITNAIFDKGPFLEGLKAGYWRPGTVVKQGENYYVVQGSGKQWQEWARQGYPQHFEFAEGKLLPVEKMSLRSAARGVLGVSST